jgi:hypothetical protein
MYSPFAIFLLFGAPVFLFPMIGFDYLLDIVNQTILGIDALYSITASIIFFLLISLMMSLVGFIAKRKLGVSSFDV